MRKNFLRWGAGLMALGVLAGAFGAHTLEKLVEPDRLTIFNTGVRYHMYHALALLVLGVLLYIRRTSLMRYAGWLFLAGIALFSGSLYLLTFANIFNLPTSIIGPLTPIGGLCFIAGWVILFFSTFQENEKRYRKDE